MTQVIFFSSAEDLKGHLKGTVSDWDKLYQEIICIMVTKIGQTIYSKKEKKINKNWIPISNNEFDLILISEPTHKTGKQPKKDYLDNLNKLTIKCPGDLCVIMHRNTIPYYRDIQKKFCCALADNKKIFFKEYSHRRNDDIYNDIAMIFSIAYSDNKNISNYESTLAKIIQRCRGSLRYLPVFSFLCQGYDEINNRIAAGDDLDKDIMKKNKWKDVFSNESKDSIIEYARNELAMSSLIEKDKAEETLVGLINHIFENSGEDIRSSYVSAAWSYLKNIREI